MFRAFLFFFAACLLFQLAACSWEPDPSAVSLEKHGQAADHFLLRSVTRIREAWLRCRNELRLAGNDAQSEVERKLQEKAVQAIHDTVSTSALPVFEADRDLEADLNDDDDFSADANSFSNAEPQSSVSPENAQTQSADAAPAPQSSTVPSETNERPAGGNPDPWRPTPPDFAKDWK